MALKLIFMGTPEFAVPILKTINNSEHNFFQFILNPQKKKVVGKN